MAKPDPLLVLGGALAAVGVVTAFPSGRLGIVWGAPIRNGLVTDGWGRPREYRSGIHRGIDVRGAVGDPVYAAADAVVSSVDLVDNSFAGVHVVLRSATNGTGGWAFHRYLHLSRALVARGDVVRRGQLIGLVGTTGTSTGIPHLHFDVAVSPALAWQFVAQFGAPNPAPTTNPNVPEPAQYVPAETLIPGLRHEADVVAWARAHGVRVR